MRAFHVDGMTAEEFVDRVVRDLRSRELDRIVSLRHADGRLVVRFSWLGASELRYVLTERGTGFDAEPDGHRIATLHQPFVDRFEDRFDHVLESVGATPR